MALLLALVLQVAVSAERVNFGPLTSSEETSFVRFGQSGQETVFGLRLDRGPWYAALRLAPTSLHVWPTTDTVIEGGVLDGRSSDPRRSRWHYRSQGRAVDTVLWSEIVAGRKLGPLHVGAGLVELAGADAAWWGAKLGPQPMGEIGFRAYVGMLGLGCRASAVPVAYLWGRWSVLEHAARDVGSTSVKRVVVPVACGLSLRGG